MSQVSLFFNKYFSAIKKCKKYFWAIQKHATSHIWPLALKFADQKQLFSPKSKAKHILSKDHPTWSFISSILMR